MASLFSGRTLLAAGLRQQARRSAATGGRRAASSEAEKAAEAARIREYLKKHNAENGWSVPPTHPLSCQPRFGPRCAGWRAPRACWPERPGGGRPQARGAEPDGGGRPCHAGWRGHRLHGGWVLPHAGPVCAEQRAARTHPGALVCASFFPHTVSLRSQTLHISTGAGRTLLAEAIARLNDPWDPQDLGH